MSERERAGLLEGDLDNIVLMALRKEPQRRYGSVEQMATDIQRYLSDLPVSASADTVGYRASKFVRRHKAAVVAAIAIAVVLLAGMAATLYEARIARMQEIRAEKRFNELRKIANSLMFEIYDSVHDLPGSTAARKLLEIVPSNIWTACRPRAAMILRCCVNSLLHMNEWGMSKGIFSRATLGIRRAQ